jgi:hypothetical protein
MSEDRPETTAVAVRPQRVPVADLVPVFDTARFEHYGRIASVMAQSNLVPETLKGGDRDTAIANCIQVVELADRLGFSPFAVAQCASVVYGKLMLEGKFVDAALQAKTGIELRTYYTGERGKPERRIYITDAELTEEQYDALEPGKYPFGVKMIDGSVREWQTFKKGTQNPTAAWEGNADSQLGYRGKREWVRAYKPGVILGVLTDDEVQDFGERRLEASAPLLSADGFEAAKPQKRARKPAGAAAANPTAEPEESLHASAEAQDEAEDAEFEDGGLDERPTTAEGATETDGAQSAEQQPDTSGSAAAASEPTRAPPDTIYTLSGDEPGDDGKIPTYKDGVAFSRVKPDAKVRPAPFDQHAPAKEPVEDERANGYRDAAASGGPGPHPEAEFEDEAPAPEQDAVAAALTKITEAPHYLGAKQQMKALTTTDDWKTLPPERQRGVRLALWKRYRELCESGAETIQPFEDFLLMRAFLESGAKTPLEVDTEWGRFIRHDAYKGVSEGDRGAMTKLMNARKAELKEV